ncbi:MAG: MBL fold metallo-hydrolase [Planktomarina sp.]
MKHALLAAVMALVPSLSWSQALDIQPITDGVWAFVGEKAQRSPENLANNSTHGLVVTNDGAVLMDPGGSWEGAKALDAAIQTVTDAPVKYVINTGGQDHRWLGNGYWQAKGATVIASTAAVTDHKDRASMQMTALSFLIGDALEGTEPSYADITFEDTYTLDLGGITFEITHAAHAHTPGDSFVWVPSKDTVFTGDIVYVERILGVMEFSSISGWVEAFEAMAATGATHVVPGHGSPTDMATATKDTYDYLVNLRTQISALIDDGGDIIAAPAVDQMDFGYLEQFDMLAGRNAQTAFQQMEWE